MHNRNTNVNLELRGYMETVDLELADLDDYADHIVIDTLSSDFPYDFKNKKVKDIKEKIQEFLDHSLNTDLDAGVFFAAYELDIPLAHVEDCYAGKFDNNVEFAQHYADEIGIEIPSEWPIRHVNWEKAAHELMFDHSEWHNHYFNNNW